MATFVEGGNGPFRGKVGTVVGYMWKQRACMRTYVKNINYPNTAGQQQERSWFVGMVRFASCAKQALRLGLRHQADEARMTEGNYFVMKNKRFFGRDGDALNVDYSQLEIAHGPAADVYFRPPKFEEDETVTVDFEKNALSLRASGDDSVYLYCYAPALGRGLLAAPVARRSKRVSVRLPEEWSGHEVHLYGFVVDRDGRPSNSTYIGVGRVNHYEYRGRYIPINKNWNDFVDIATEVNGEVQNIDSVDSTVMKMEEAGGVPAVDLFGDPPEVP